MEGSREEGRQHPGDAPHAWGKAGPLLFLWGLGGQRAFFLLSFLWFMLKSFSQVKMMSVFILVKKEKKKHCKLVFIWLHNNLLSTCYALCFICIFHLTKGPNVGLYKSVISLKHLRFLRCMSLLSFLHPGCLGRVWICLHFCICI